jgi:glycosyltransferase involved in cell wall biosynthesis
MRRWRVLQAITRMIHRGAQVHTLQTCRHLDPARFEVHLLTGPELGSEGTLLEAAREVIPVTMIPHLRREIRPWVDWMATREIRAHLRARRYDVVHTNTSKAGVLVRRAAAEGGVPAIIHTVHGWQWSPARSPLMNRFIIASERRMAAITDRIVVVADTDREKGLAAGVGRPEQYVVIESAIPLEAFDPDRVSGAGVRIELAIPPHAPVAGTVGPFVRQKAPEIMLEAAGVLLERLPGAHFIYLGDGPDRKRWFRRYDHVTGHPRFHHLGIRGDVAPVVAAFDVFLLSSRYEGLPRVVVEAMALGKPVVSTPADGVVEVVLPERTGALVPHEDGRALGEAAARLLGRVDLARTWGGNARALACERFALPSMIRRIESLYEEVLAEKGAGVSSPLSRRRRVRARS